MSIRPTGGAASNATATATAVMRLNAVLGAVGKSVVVPPEPATAPATMTELDALLADMKGGKVSVLLVEQNAFHALRLATRGYVMVNGEITLTGTGAELLSNEEVRAAYLEGGH